MNSNDLKEAREKERIVPPARYYHPRSWLDFWEKVLPVSLVAVLTLVLVEWIVFLLSYTPWTLSARMPWLGTGMVVITLLFIVFWNYRAHWARMHRFIYADPKTDLVTIHQKGHFWLALSTSDPDEFDVSQIQILDTKDRRFFQRGDLPWIIKFLAFDCGDIELPGNRPPLRNVQFIPELLAIQKHRKSLKSQSIRNEEHLIDIGDASLREQELHTGQLEEILKALRITNTMLRGLIHIFTTARDDDAARRAAQEDTLDTEPIEAVVVEEDSPEKD